MSLQTFLMVPKLARLLLPCCGEQAHSQPMLGQLFSLRSGE
jgi:hypothetical protein